MNRIITNNTEPDRDVLVPPYVYTTEGGNPAICDKLNIVAQTTYRDKKLERDNQKQQSGFEDMPAKITCTNPSHEPPMHMVIPQGKIYRHVCPGCGRVTRIAASQIRW